MVDVVAVSRAGAGASSLTGRVAVQIQPACHIQAASLEMGDKRIETAVLRDDTEDPVRIVSRTLAEAV
ncbi:hypothetical protein CKO29_17210 [Allochromatium vinosum]|nr:hypothetical protein [Allochromatium vinosum]